MKMQIRRLSPHQNGKVFAILMAISSLFIMVPMMLSFALARTGAGMAGRPVPHLPMALLFVIPVIYFIMGYIMTAGACWFYNFMFKYSGGIEYESQPTSA